MASVTAGFRFLALIFTRFRGLLLYLHSRTRFHVSTYLTFVELPFVVVSDLSAEFFSGTEWH